MLALFIGVFFVNSILAQYPVDPLQPIEPISCMIPKPPKGWKISDCKRENKQDAVSAGKDAQGNEIFIGRGKFDGFLTPGRITFEAVAGKPAGLCVERVGKERCSSRRVEYLVRNPNCNYKWIPSSNGLEVKNAKIINSGSVNYYIGRVSVDGGYQVGKVLLGDKFYAPNLEASSYEVLVLYCKRARCIPVPAPKPTTTTPPQTTTTPAPTTTTPPASTTTAAPAPSTCDLVCSSSILDSVGCRCCEFSDFTRYEALQTQLKSIEDDLSTQTVNAALQDQIDTLKNDIAKIEEAVVGSCGSTDSSTISGFFDYADTSLQALTVSVSSFDFTFNPSKCKLSCEEANGYAPVWKKCKCMFLAGYETLFAYKKEYNTLFNSLFRTTFDVVEYYQKVEQLQIEFNFLWEVISAIQWGWDSYSEAEKTTKIAEVQTRTSSISVTINGYIISNTCGNACEYFSIPDSTKDCACDGSNEVIAFYNTFEKFKNIENDVRNANFLNYTDEETRFEAWTKTVRSLAVDFYKAVNLQGIAADVKATMLAQFVSEFESLKVEWEIFRVKLVVKKECTRTCSGDTVKRCNPCECAAVSGWENLLTVIYPDIDATLAEIAALADGSNKDTLKSNTDKVKAEIEKIKAYAENSDNCDGLDVGSISGACSTLTSQYSTTKADIIRVQNSVSSGTCSITCPNSRWVQTVSPCACKCLPFTCVVGSQALDIYNCQCAPVSSCTETQSNCSAQGLILDYAECTCKPRPGA